jgi:hypothetical protein
MANSIQDRKNASIRSFEENLKKAADGGFYIPDPREARKESLTPDQFEERFPELMYDTPIVHESRISSRRPPIHLENAFQNVFGDRSGLRLIFDDYLRRWSIIQHCADGQWREGMVFMRPPVPGKLPADLSLANIDGRYDGMIGVMGEFIEPSAEDMAWYRETFDLLEKKGKVGREIKKHKDSLVDHTRKEFVDFEEDFMQYNRQKLYRDYGHYDLELALSGVKVASGLTGLPFVPTTSADAIVNQIQQEKYIYEDRGGYKIKRKNPDYQPILENPLKSRFIEAKVQGMLEDLPTMTRRVNEIEAQTEKVSVDNLGLEVIEEKVYGESRRK